MVLGEELYLIFLLPYVGTADREISSFSKHLYFLPHYLLKSAILERKSSQEILQVGLYSANFKGKHFLFSLSLWEGGATVFNNI